MLIGNVEQGNFWGLIGFPLPVVILQNGLTSNWIATDNQLKAENCLCDCGGFCRPYRKLSV